ncbi:iron ABC transporter permease [Streptomyces sp. SCUT-3]|uniref:FecCD family ABC transporter permease n=2 Tax=Streptomyces TaxID=1883 RepID=UPI002174F89E|nr:iron ABC transporter permease [Streptomyces sp. SCUT-3]
MDAMLPESDGGPSGRSHDGPHADPPGTPSGRPSGAPPGRPSGDDRARGRRPLRAGAAWAVLLLALLLTLLLSLAVGSRPIPPAEVLRALLHGGDGAEARVVLEMRLPRTVIGLMVGAALGLAGAVLQGLTRNPIAEPGVLGLGQGASCGVVLAIALFGVHTLSGYVWFAFAGAAAAAVVAYAVAAGGRGGRGGATPVKLALAGAAVNAFAVAVISAVVTTDATVNDEFRFWQVGALSGRGTDVASQVLPFLAAGAVLVLVAARGLDALALGDDTARGLGQNVAVVRVTGAAGATVLTGAAVAAAGPVAFVGLAVPHVARALVGADHRRLLAACLLLGPVMLLLSDVVGRIVFPPSEVPAGVMTALVGVPFLVATVRRRAVVAA